MQLNQGWMKGDRQLQESLQRLAPIGEGAFSFQNTEENQRKILNAFQQFNLQDTSAGIDWDWAKKLLKIKELASIRDRLDYALRNSQYLMPIGLETCKWQELSQFLQSDRWLHTHGTEQDILGKDQLLIETFCREGSGKLLILGTPGAGKTTALLELAEQLVCGALAHTKTIIPVLFELSTWRKDDQRIEEWLIEQLYEMHGGSRTEKRYEKWLERQVLLPLMDGLDELGLERQILCTRKLNEFLRTYPHAVVCCRTKEFREANVSFKDHLPTSVQLAPLSDPQIQNYLKIVGRSQLWSDIQGNEHLQQMLEPTKDGEPGLLRIPLFVSLTARVYDPQYPFQSKSDLLKQYVAWQLSKDVRGSDRRKELEGRSCAYKQLQQEPSRQKTTKTLGWVARQLTQENQVELLIERIQPRWLDRASKRIYRLSYGLLFGLIYGLIVSPFLGLIDVSLLMWIYGPLLGLIYGLIYGLIGELVKKQETIETVAVFKITMSQEVRQKMFKTLREWLVSGLIGGLIIGLISELINGVISGLVMGLMIGLIRGLNFGIVRGLKQELKLRLRPNQGIHHSLQNLFLTTLFSYPFGILLAWGALELPSIVIDISDGEGSVNIFQILNALPNLLLPGILGALFLGFALGGGQAVVQHYCLRFVLWQRGIAPWDLPQFLNYCVERRLLQRVGGRYRFLHRELLDYFATLE